MKSLIRWFKPISKKLYDIFLEFREYSDKDISYTRENFSLYGKALKADEKRNILKKFDKIKVKTLNKISALSVITEITFYILIVFAVFLGFYFWWNYESSEAFKSDTSRMGEIVTWSISIIFLVHLLLMIVRYRYFERYIQKSDKEELPEVVKFSKRSITWIGDRMTTSWIDRYENNITGAVYFGAGFLVVTVGLRGLGEKINSIRFLFPDSIIDPRDHGIKMGVILFALFLEFSLLLILATFTFFKDEETVDGDARSKRGSSKDGGTETGIGEAINVNVMNLDLLERFFMANSSAIDSLRDSFDKWTKDRIWKNNLQSIDDKMTGIMEDNSLDSGFMSVNSKLEESNKSLEDINGKLDLNYTKEVFRELIDQLNKVEPKNVVEISAAFEKIQTAVNVVSAKIKDEELNSKMEAFNNSIKEIKKTLGVALVESGNGTKPIINQ